MIEKERISAIKNCINLLAYLQSRGCIFKKAGRSYFCRCPFPDHEDKTPSFSVTLEKQVFHCFGCGKGGDVFKFVMDFDHVTFPEAVTRLEKESLLEKGGL